MQFNSCTNNWLISIKYRKYYTHHHYSNDFISTVAKWFWIIRAVIIFYAMNNIFLIVVYNYPQRLIISLNFQMQFKLSRNPHLIFSFLLAVSFVTKTIACVSDFVRLLGVYEYLWELSAYKWSVDEFKYILDLL